MDLIHDPGHSGLSQTSFGGDLVSIKARFRAKQILALVEGEMNFIVK